MTSDFFSQVSMAGSESLESFQQLCEINAQAARRLAGIQLELANLGVESTLAQTRLLTGGNYGDVIRAQPQLASEYGHRLFEIGCEAAGALYESRDRILSWANRAASSRTAGVPRTGTKAAPRSGKRSTRRRKAA